MRQVLFNLFANSVLSFDGQLVLENSVFSDEAKKEMLYLDKSGRQLAGFVAGEEDGAASFFGKAFKHGAMPTLDFVLL